MNQGLLKIAPVTTLVLYLQFFCLPNHAQEEALEADASIARMQARIVQIEKEMEAVNTEQSQDLAEEAYGLFDEVDQTFLQLRNTFQQQVVQLNQQMQRKWEQIESAIPVDRTENKNQLAKLEQDWEKSFDRLTTVYDRHLEHLKNELAKVRGTFSEVAGKARVELEATNFEARARWERSHDILMTANRTYIRLVGNQLNWLESQLVQQPKDEALRLKVSDLRKRYVQLQDRFRVRLNGHTRHLKDELETRMAQLKVTRSWDSRRNIYKSLDNLYERTHKTYGNKETGCQESLATFANERAEASTTHGRQETLNHKIAKCADELRLSYLERADFIRDQCTELEARISASASVDEKSAWMASVTDLRLLAKDLEIKAGQIVSPKPVEQTVRR